jgi:hypothetical protein
MAKPMLVTLPFVLLLLDVWPLRRLELGGAGQHGPAAVGQRWPERLRLVKEKLPLFVLAALSSIMTVVAQRHGGAMPGFERFPLGLRLANAAASYLAYLGKTLWPARLAAFYVFPATTPVWQACLGAALLIGVTVLAIRTVRGHGYFLVGWLWYVGTLIPVIGLVQVGEQAMADRYTYIPLIGLFLIVAWGAPELVARWPQARRALPAVAACILLLCGALARAQVRYWSDGNTLWRHALVVTENNYIAHNNLGATLIQQGRAEDALPHLVEAVRLRPSFALARNNLGI